METAWTENRGKSRSVQTLPGTASHNTSACTFTAHSTEKETSGFKHSWYVTVKHLKMSKGEMTSGYHTSMPSKHL